MAKDRSVACTLPRFGTPRRLPAEVADRCACVWNAFVDANFRRSGPCSSHHAISSLDRILDHRTILRLHNRDKTTGGKAALREFDLHRPRLRSGCRLPGLPCDPRRHRSAGGRRTYSPECCPGDVLGRTCHGRHRRGVGTLFATRLGNRWNLI